jgi:hypothetical protein
MEAQLLDGVVSALHGDDLVSLVLETLHQHVAQAGIVLCDQDAHDRLA